eukprot:TRINITY_DN40403_c0_g1_i1.p1 TRINITY_DN40403_c0_g1~~TRINITY_DN40403_c0_g1_i1.p1  ORF type:complete len:1308 (+),score=185.59 TRINITY_DN40403_c0_g1_i1:69-3926(+)
MPPAFSRPAAPLPLPFYGLLCWVLTLVPHTRRKGGLMEEHLPDLMPSLRSRRATAAAAEKWLRLCAKSKQPSLIWMLLRLNILQVIWSVSMQTAMALIMCLGRPLAVQAMVRAAQAGKAPWEATMELVCVGLVILVEGISWMVCRHCVCDTCGTHVMSTIGGLVINKAIKIMDSQGLSDEKVLVAVDAVGKVNSSFSILGLFLSNALGIIIGTVVAAWVIGPATFPGVAVAFVAMFFQKTLGDKAGNLEKAAIKSGEQRMQTLNEILSNIKGVKIHAWEHQFLARMEAFRAEETNKYGLWHRMRSTGVNVCRSLPVLCSCVTFSIYALSGGELTPDIIFPTLAVFQGMRMPMVLLPLNMVNVTSFRVSMQRVRVFLQADEVPARAPISDVTADDSDKGIVATMKGAVVGYGSDNDGVVLRDINFVARRGEVVGIVGAVASGKSTLLLSLLGELPLHNGSAATVAHVGFAPQKPVVISGSLMENVLAGREHDEKRLREVLRASCLEEDLQQLVDGLQTEIGERGVTLSGGQQQRLSLARAMYGQPDLLVLDDPLSAVDVHTGATLMTSIAAYAHEAPSDAAKKSPAVIMVMNQPHALTQCDRFLMLGDASVVVSGSPREMVAASCPSGVSEKVAEYFQLMAAAVAAEGRCTDGSLGVRDALASPEQTKIGDLPSTEKYPPATDISRPEMRKPTSSFQLVKADLRQQGSTSHRVYREYIRSVGAWRLALSLFLFFLSSAAYAANDFWLMYWTRGGADKGAGIAVLLCTTLCYALGAATAANSWYIAARWGGKQIFHDCMKAVLAAPLAWFDETPSGRITSRFSADLNGVDNSFQMYVDALSQFVFLMLAIIGVSIYINPWFAVIIAIYLSLLWCVIRLTGAINRDTKRLSNLALSPVLTNIMELRLTRQAGLLRPMALEEFFTERHHSLMDCYGRAFFVGESVKTWGNFACYVLSSVMSVGSAFTVLLINSSPEGAGLQVVYCFILPFTINLSMMLYFMSIVGLTQLERLFELKITPAEVAWGATEDQSVEWPASGALSFRSASLRYKPGLPLAVQDVSLEIPSGSKVGLCGRTGSGKSSLLVMLLRLVELDSGSVHLSGRNLADVSLKAVRRAISMIPQEPFLISGSVRRNLDPFDEHSDEQVTAALQRVGLDRGMDDDIHGGGSNFSAGQRQLLSFSRILLQNGKVVLLDEPTSSLDPVTDAKMGEFMHDSSHGKTVLTIAHRLGTIADSNIIVVLGAGRILESGSPEQLLKTPGSHYAEMVRREGQDVQENTVDAEDVQNQVSL